MVDRSYLRVGGGAAVMGGILGVVGNLLHPRYRDISDVDMYRRIAGSGRFQAADLLIFVALLMTVVGFVAVAQALSAERGQGLARLGGHAALVGGAIAIASISLDLYALKQSAEIFASAAANDRAGAFWATNAIDHINTGMFGAWTIVFLGAAPLLIGVAVVLSRQWATWLGIGGVAGGALCLAVGFINLSRGDQTATQIPFLVGSLLVTGFLIAAGIRLWRGAVAAPGLVNDEQPGSSRSAGA
jgi:Domain of unknown function (DUF4386)